MPHGVVAKNLFILFTAIRTTPYILVVQTSKHHTRRRWTVCLPYYGMVWYHPLVRFLHLDMMLSWHSFHSHRSRTECTHSWRFEQSFNNNIESYLGMYALMEREPSRGFMKSTNKCWLPSSRFHHVSPTRTSSCGWRNKKSFQVPCALFKTLNSMV